MPETRMLMSAKCPRCSQPLYLKVIVTEVFSIKDISINDVFVEEPVDSSRSLQLKCMDCDFAGWLDDYHVEAAGVKRLFDKKGKLICTCSLKP